MPVAVVSDTCHYLPAETVAEHDIRLVSLYVHMQDDTRRESEITNYDDYYDRLRTSTDLPTTSQPSIGDFLAVYEPLLAEGYDIVSVHLAGGMSGTVRSAEQAREQLGDRAERVHVVDSASACGGEGLVVLAAAAAARSGADAAAVAAHTRAGAQGAEAVVRDRHARVPPPRGPDRRRSGVAWLGAADQADPHGRVGDHPGRARAYLASRV